MRCDCAPCWKTHAREGSDYAARCVLDRDGLVNRALLEKEDRTAASPSDLRVLPGVREACRHLREAGCALILITTNSDIARGAIRRTGIEINSLLQRYLHWTTSACFRTTTTPIAPA